MLYEQEEAGMYSLSERWHLEATDEQRRELEALAHSRDRMEADRSRAVLGRLDGQTSPTIASGLRTRPEQVRHWCSLFAHGGVAALRARPHPGRPPKVGEPALATVAQILAEPSPPGVVWTVARLREEIRRRTGIDISEGHLGRLMKKKGACGGDGRGTH
jgi:transposase